MSQFRTIDDVDAWLEPMDYETFWREIRPYCLVLEYRSVCDAKIATGVASEETILTGLKMMARRELARRHKLHWKEATPWLRPVDTH
jgi:hypothetical protein